MRQTERSQLVNPVYERQRALIERVLDLGYTNAEIERILGVGRLKQSREGAETSGERIHRFLKHKHAMSAEKHVLLCAAVFADSKLKVADDLSLWMLPTCERQALAPFLFLSSTFSDKLPDRHEARRVALSEQQQLSKLRRNERDSLAKIVRRFVERVSKLVSLLADQSSWTNNYRLFATQESADLVQLDVVGAGNSYFVYKWDQAGPVPLEFANGSRHPCVFENDESCPKLRFQSLLMHLQIGLRRIRFDSRFSSSDFARIIRAQARSIQSAIEALRRYMNEPRFVSWVVGHPICDLDEQWWQHHPMLSPVLIRYRLANGQDWTPLPESQIAQPILFGREHNTNEKRFLRFLELVRDAAATIRPDLMIDIGADLIGVDAGKTLSRIGRHG